MKNNSLKSLSDSELLNSLLTLVCKERKLLTDVLHHLREVESRRLYAELGYSSMFEYAVKELKYSESSAHRRISAMRVMKEVPEIEAALSDGSLTLTTVTQAKSLFMAEKRENGKIYSSDEKRAVLELISGKSKAETEKILITISPLAVAPKEKTKALNAAETLITFTADQALIDKLSRIKDLKPEVAESYLKLLHLMADQTLAKIDPLSQNKKSLPPEQVKVNSPHSRYIPKALKSAVWKQCKSQCAYIDPQSRRRCTGTSGLQIDHITPLALGGKTEFKNLRLLCHAHNQLMADKVFGREKMACHRSQQSAVF